MNVSACWRASTRFRPNGLSRATASFGRSTVQDWRVCGVLGRCGEGSAPGERRRRLCGSPTAPANLNAPVVSALSVQLIWDASTDDVGVTGYDVIRDSAVLARVSSPGYTDSAVLPGEIHRYAVRARDASGNISALRASVAVLTPDAATPVFADGFESGNVSAWNTGVTGLVVESTDVHSGASAAEGKVAPGAAFARKALPSTYSDAYARVAFKVTSQTSQIILLRLRADAATTNAGYVFRDQPAGSELSPVSLARTTACTVEAPVRPACAP